MITPMRLRPIHVLVGAACIVAASALEFSHVTGYGTILYQIVVFSAMGILDSLTSGGYADTHHRIVWITAAAISLTIFLIPEAVMWFSARKRWPVIFSAVTCVWCGFYLLSLFCLFPATDGP